MLRFQKKVNNTGKHDLYLETKGLDIPDEESVETYKLFCVKTYNKLYSKKRVDGWEVNFNVVNSFFETLSNSDQSKIVMAFLTIHHELVTYMKARQDISDIDIILNKAADIIFLLEQELSLFDRIENFCEHELPINTKKNAGNRAQDTPVLTWLRPDVVKLTAVVVLSKMLAPLYGTFMFYIKDQKGVDNKLKQLHASVLINKVLTHRCGPLMEKLKFTIKHYMKREFKEDMSAICTGLTTNTLLDIVQAFLLVRYFVNVDLYYPNGNLITYVRVSIRNAVYGQQNPNNRNMVMLREDINFSGSEESRKSQLEWDSVSSSTTADAPILITAAVSRLVTRLLMENDIGVTVFKRNLAFYKRHPIELHIVNKFLLYMYMGHHLGGAKSLSSLRANEMIQLITVLQLILLKLGFDELAYVVTANVGTLAKPSQDSHDIMLKNAYKGSAAYRNYRSELENADLYPSAAPKVFDQMLSDLANAITTNVFVYNLATSIINQIDTEESVNGKGIKFSNECIPKMCQFIELNSR